MTAKERKLYQKLIAAYDKTDAECQTLEKQIIQNVKDLAAKKEARNALALDIRNLSDNYFS